MSTILDRRQFLHTSLALAITADPSLPPIIDTHQHLWQRKQFKLAWIPKGSILDRDYLEKDYEAAVRGLNVVQAVYLEVDVAEEQQLAEAEWIARLCESGKSLTRAAVISGRPGSDGFDKYIRRFRGSPSIRGVRRVLHSPDTPPGHCLEKPFVRGIRLLGELDLHFELCLRPADLREAIQLVDACPDTRFVLDHCGNADLKKHDQWKKDIADLAKRKNVVGKVSGVIAQVTKEKWTAEDLAPVVKHTLEVFGPDRVMFGSDWPVCLLGATLAEWVTALRQIVADRPAAEQRKLFHDNAQAFYRLKKG